MRTPAHNLKQGRFERTRRRRKSLEASRLRDLARLEVARALLSADANEVRNRLYRRSIETGGAAPGSALLMFYTPPAAAAEAPEVSE